MGIEYVLTFQEKRTFLREEGFKRRQVDHHVIGLNGAKVWVESGRQQRVAGGPPVDVGANFRVQVITQTVEAGCRERVEGQLASWLDIL